jgi:hypothetical protein
MILGLFKYITTYVKVSVIRKKMTKHEKHKMGIWLWLTVTILFMGVIYFISSTPYEKQNIKPILGGIEISQNTLPDIQLDYDEQYVSSNDP